MKNNAVLPGRLGLLLLGLGLLGCPSQTVAPPAPPPPAVSVARPVEKQIVEWDPYTGRLEAVEFVEVRARVGGYLDSIHFTEGLPVKKGDLLFVIDPRPFRAVVRQAEAQLTEAKARLEEAKAAKLQSEAEKKRTEAQLKLARQKLDRTRTLIGQNVLTTDDLDQAVSEFDQSTANVDFAAANIVSREADIATAEGAIETANANLEQAQLELSYTELKAPISGLISRINVTQGNLIEGGTANSTLLTTIVSLDPIHCYFDANEQELLKYTRLAQQGTRESSRSAKNPAYLELVDEKNFPHLGHMDFVDNRVDPNTGTIRGRAIFRNPDGLLQPGLFARVMIPGSAPYRALLIPDAAIQNDQSEKFVYVARDGKAIRTPVQVGPLVDGLRVVRSGLTASDELVISGLQRVQHDSPITVEQGTIETLAVDDGLPDTFEPLPPEQWISRNDPPGRAELQNMKAAVPSPPATAVSGEEGAR